MTEGNNGKTELEKMKSGETFRYNSPELMLAKERARIICRKLHDLPEEAAEERKAVAGQLFGSCGENLTIKQPFHCDYGFNISIGDNVLLNYSCVFLDAAPITIGDNTLIGPMAGFYTIMHDLNPVKRNEGIAISQPITIGKNVWIGGSVTVLPGVTIGDGAVIGAGSVVTKDIPAGCIAVGNPARVVRHI